MIERCGGDGRGLQGGGWGGILTAQHFAWSETAREKKRRHQAEWHVLTVSKAGNTEFQTRVLTLCVVNTLGAPCPQKWGWPLALRQIQTDWIQRGEAYRRAASCNCHTEPPASEEVYLRTQVTGWANCTGGLGPSCLTQGFPGSIYLTAVGPSMWGSGRSRGQISRRWSEGMRSDLLERASLAAVGTACHVVSNIFI